MSPQILADQKSPPAALAPPAAWPSPRPLGEGDLLSLRTGLTILAFSSSETRMCANLHVASLFLQLPWLKK